jgi:hypothetical protein
MWRNDRSSPLRHRNRLTWIMASGHEDATRQQRAASNPMLAMHEDATISLDSREHPIDASLQKVGLYGMMIGRRKRQKLHAMVCPETWINSYFGSQVDDPSNLQRFGKPFDAIAWNTCPNCEIRRYPTDVGVHGRSIL